MANAWTKASAPARLRPTCSAPPARLPPQLERARLYSDVALKRARRDAPKDLPFRSGPARVLRARAGAVGSQPPGAARRSPFAPLPAPAHASRPPAQHRPTSQTPTTLPACSRDAKKVFEAALMESRRMSMSFITPEHIALAVLAVGDTASRALLEG